MDEAVEDGESLSEYLDKVHNGIFEIPLNRCMYIEQYLKEIGTEQVEV